MACIKCGKPEFMCTCKSDLLFPSPFDTAPCAFGAQNAGPSVLGSRCPYCGADLAYAQMCACQHRPMLGPLGDGPGMSRTEWLLMPTPPGYIKF